MASLTQTIPVSNEIMRKYKGDFTVKNRCLLDNCQVSYLNTFNIY